jgi:hypothetical protein
VSFLSGGSWTSDPRERADARLVEQRRTVRDDRVAEATLACPGCDAPVAIGPARMSVTDSLRCPFCDRTGPVREFLSLAVPTRPTRVVVRIGFGGVR